MSSILIIEDSQDTRENIAELLIINGYKVHTAENGQTALRLIKTQTPDCVILDIRLPDMTGHEILKQIQNEIESGLVVIIITAYGEVSMAVNAMKMGAYDYLEKPFENAVLLMVVKRGLENQQVKRELTRLRQILGADQDSEQIFGHSPAIKKVISQINSVAQTDLTVLIQGETGTGKEVAAHLLHNKSKRAKQPFIAIDCGAIPENLIESEFFGFEKGAFTGASQSRPGKFQLAHHGTLYLDEIGNLPLSQQRPFLRAIENKAFRPIGAVNESKVDIRLIIASNANLIQLVSENKFRKDLYYRISEYTITMPPLRERVEDIPHLTALFLSEANFEFDRKITDISEDAMAKLLSYNWPGNVRQLRNVIRKAALLATDTIRPSHISLSLEFEPENQEQRFFTVYSNDINKYPNYRIAYAEFTREFEKELIKKAYENAHGNITKAARIYGIDRRNFYHKLDKYGKDFPEKQ
ncbi:MAG TPA: sigma-54 dependent transcriptional regulator [Candidatus Marinimicrobia bacterium]|nr:sigma-54 dependent transcriptional regulator [Candidatus Neomarinimicrobiota bacterium]HRS51578.1 sigma-54 dependent transcriptional regulator [Candidatus Neomarinimicrobiota bacterium]HRU92344.1 sigma-54 dependent transcriptional regulator [Candidatus Neomarinimicrobiota bacterium]